MLNYRDRPSDRVREKKKIVRVLGGKLCGKKRRLRWNCVGLHNRLNKQKDTRHG